MVKKIFSAIDWYLFLPTLFLCSLSILIIQSIAPNLLPIHIATVFIGFLFFFVFASFDYHLFERLITPIFILSIFALILTFLFGQEARGSLRWIEIGNIKLQASELIKPFLIIFFAKIFIGKPRLFSKIVANTFFFLIPFALVFKQPDLGNALIYLLIFSGILMLSGVKLRVIFSGLLLFFISSPIVWHLLKDYQKQRVITFLTPGLDPQGAGYNALQATIAVGSGGFWGRGLGWGTQSHLKFLPEYHTDFIFASLAEELGFLGVTILIILYLAILTRLLVIAKQAPDRFSTLIAIGVFIMILSQVFINIGMNVGLVPITGITLPLISYGNNSLIATLSALGVVQSISKSTQALKLRPKA